MSVRGRPPRRLGPIGARAASVGAFVFALESLASRRAAALDRKLEAAATAALKTAASEYTAGAREEASELLQKTLTACGADRCSAPTRAALLRDAGAVHFRSGERGAAEISWAEALRLDSQLRLNPAYESLELRAEWELAKDEASLASATQPRGDFTHTPAAEQAARTPLPVYVEYAGRGAVARVALRYKGAGMREWKRAWLPRRGRGWGGLVPCADVTRGVMRYYLQGFTEDDDPIASSGSATEPFFVPIRSKLAGAPPRLPGAEPPTSCDEPGGADTSEPSKSEDVAAAPPPPQGAGAFARWWIGVAGSLDIVSLPGASDVCKLTSQALPANSSGYYCTTPDGADFPSRRNTAENDSLANGSAGAAQGRLTARDVRVVLTVDYALTSSALLGVRVGGVLNGYPVTEGRVLPLPLHLELRATYLFGDAPLARVGFAPYLSAAAGLTTFDARTPVTVTRVGIAGQKTVDAWRTAGPGFVAFGCGARYAFSPRAGFLAGVRAAGAFGSGSVLAALAPELSLQLGF